MNAFGILAGGGLLMVAVIATSALIARYNPFYRRELAESGNRALTLDGLRGMAALMVMTHHAAISCTWLVTGAWGDARSPVWQLSGPAGVMLFFMLTGFLFWGKARAGNGRVNVWKLWRGRLYRIAPLYLFSLLLILIAAVSHTGGGWLTLENWKPLSRLFALGALNWHDIGPVTLGDYNAGVVWTLRYEWLFYFILPFIAWLAPGRKILWVALLAYVLTFIGLWFNLNLQPGLFFILGMLCTCLLAEQPVSARLRQPAAAALAIILTGLLCVASRDYLFSKVHSLSIAGAFFPVFFVAAAGNSLFGILTHSAVRCLGAMSFSLYLLHGIVLRLVFRILREAGWTDLSQPACWLIAIITAIAITLLSATTYRWIEFPFLSSSHKKPA